MARCRCSAGTCECSLQAGQNIRLSGVGDSNDPWIISSDASARNAIEFIDSPEVDFSVVGLGIATDPYIVTAALPWIDSGSGVPGEVLTKDESGVWVARPPAPTGVAGSLDFTDSAEVAFDVVGGGTPDDPQVVTASLPWVDPTAGSPGEVLAKQADGSWAPAPPATVAVGAVAVGDFLIGDGSAGNPIRPQLITDNSMAGTGTLADPLRTSVVIGQGLAGEGSMVSPLRLCLMTYDDLKNAAGC